MRRAKMSRCEWTRLGAISAGLSLACSAAGAEGGVDELKRLSMADLMQVEVATVTTASKLAEKVTEAPAMVLVLDRHDIELRGYATLVDVMRDLPGLETVESYFSEIGTLVPVRGIVGNNKIIVLIDGMRVNPPGGENFPLRSDIDVRHAEQIEIMYGPGSILYGQDAISAVVNIKTRRPSHTGWAGSAGGALATEQGRAGWGSLLSSFGPEGKGQFSASVAYQISDLTRIDENYADWYEAYQVVARTTQPTGLGLRPYRTDRGLNLATRASYGDYEIQVWHRSSERSSSEGFSPVLGYLEEAAWGDSSTVIEGRHVLALREDLQLDSSVVYNRYEIDPDSRYVFPVPTSGGSRWFFDDFKYGRGTGLTLEETLRYSVSDTLSLLGGMTAGTFDIIPKSTVPGGADTGGDITDQAGSFAYLDPVTGATNLIPRAVEKHYETYAGYLEAGWQFLPDFKLIVGSRLTKDTRFDDIPFTPRAALIYNITKDLTARYTYTKAYVAPAPYFSYATFDNGQLLADSNPDINPEIADSHEVNVTYARRNLTTGASAYYGHLRDLIILADQAAPQNVVAEVSLPDGSRRTLVRAANGGENRNYGFDIYSRFSVDSVAAWVSYSYVDLYSELWGEKQSLAGISQHNGRLGITWSPVSRFFITPSLVVRSTPEGVRGGALEDELHLPYEVNLHTLYRITDQVRVFLTVRNLTDHQYALGGITGDAIPQETFRGQAGIQVDF